MYNKVNNLFYVSYIESQRLIRKDFTKVLKDPGCRHEKYTQKKKNIKQDFNNYIYRIKNFVKYAFSPIFFSFVLSDSFMRSYCLRKSANNLLLNVKLIDKCVF